MLPAAGRQIKLSCRDRVEIGQDVHHLHDSAYFACSRTGSWHGWPRSDRSKLPRLVRHGSSGYPAIIRLLPRSPKKISVETSSTRLQPV